MRLVAVLRYAHLVMEHKRDLDDAGEPGTHQSVAESLVGHGTDHQLLGVGRHGPAGNSNDEARNEVPLGVAVPVAAEPDTSQAGAPPDYSHGGVLPVVLHPGGAPPVLGEGVDAAPCGDDDAVEELLRAAHPPHPELTDQHGDGHEDAVGNEGTAHDEVGRALAQVVALTEAQGGYASKQHLCPADDREGLAVDTMDGADDRPYALVDAPFQVQPEVDAEDELDKQLEVEIFGKLGVDVVVAELPTAVLVAKYEADEGEDCS